MKLGQSLTIVPSSAVPIFSDSFMNLTFCSLFHSASPKLKLLQKNRTAISGISTCKLNLLTEESSVPLVHRLYGPHSHYIERVLSSYWKELTCSQFLPGRKGTEFGCTTPKLLLFFIWYSYEWKNRVDKQWFPLPLCCMPIGLPIN